MHVSWRRVRTGARGRRSLHAPLPVDTDSNSGKLHQVLVAWNKRPLELANVNLADMAAAAEIKKYASVSWLSVLTGTNGVNGVRPVLPVHCQPLSP